jgi:hypothetical protein
MQPLELDHQVVVRLGVCRVWRNAVHRADLLALRFVEMAAFMNYTAVHVCQITGHAL